MGNLEPAILDQRINLWTHEIQDRGISHCRSAQMRSGDGHCWWSDVIVGHWWRSGAINGGGRWRWSGAITSGGHWWMRGAVGGDDSRRRHGWRHLLQGLGDLELYSIKNEAKISELEVIILIKGLL